MKARQMKKLVPNITSFEEDEATAVLAFCADEGQSAEYVMLQYPLQTDEQDRCLQLDGLHIERNDQAFGCYRGVASIDQMGDRIKIALNAEGLRRMKVERIVVAHSLESKNRPRPCAPQSCGSGGFGALI